MNKINKVYNGPLLKLVHHRHLKLKVNSRDLFGKRRKKWGTKVYILLIVGPKWKLEIIWGTIESNKPKTNLQVAMSSYYIFYHQYIV